MARIVDIERERVERLAAELLPELRERGQVFVGPGHVENVERWRRAARHAARQLGERVRTGHTTNGGAWAVLDRGVTDADRRRAALAVDSVLRRTD